MPIIDMKKKFESVDVETIFNNAIDNCFEKYSKHLTKLQMEKIINEFNIKKLFNDIIAHFLKYVADLYEYSPHNKFSFYEIGEMFKISIEYCRNGMIEHMLVDTDVILNIIDDKISNELYNTSLSACFFNEQLSYFAKKSSNDIYLMFDLDDKIDFAITSDFMTFFKIDNARGCKFIKPQELKSVTELRMFMAMIIDKPEDIVNEFARSLIGLISYYYPDKIAAYKCFWQLVVNHEQNNFYKIETKDYTYLFCYTFNYWILKFKRAI